MNQAFNLKFFERGTCKCSEISQLKKSWQMDIGTQVTVIPLNTNLSCYNTVDKAPSIMSKILNLV